MTTLRKCSMGALSISAIAMLAGCIAGEQPTDGIYQDRIGGGEALFDAAESSADMEHATSGYVSSRSARIEDALSIVGAQVAEVSFARGDMSRHGIVYGILDGGPQQGSYLSAGQSFRECFAQCMLTGGDLGSCIGLCAF